MERTYVLEYARVTEAAAMACYPWIGRGLKNEADAAAVEAMRRAFDRVPARGRIVIGEGEMDEAPMLFIGESVGPKDSGLDLVEFDIAVDPLEGTTLCAKDLPGAIATLAVAPRHSMLAAPDMYMEKIATGPEGKGVVDLDQSPGENARALAAALRKRPEDLIVVVLERPRHDGIVKSLREAGVRVRLITDGDVAPAVAAAMPGTRIDMMLGTGGAPEGVLAAAALKALDGEFQGRLVIESDEQRVRAQEMGTRDPSAKLGLHDIIRGDCIFAATGVTTGPFLRGVRLEDGRVHLQSVVLRSDTGTIRYIETSTRANIE